MEQKTGTLPIANLHTLRGRTLYPPDILRGFTQWRTHSNFLKAFLHSIETHTSLVSTRSLAPSGYLF
jgi:hypothetical protein